MSTYSSATIDIAHCLYATYEVEQPVLWLLDRWPRGDLVTVLKCVYRKSGDRSWRSLAELTKHWGRGGFIQKEKGFGRVLGPRERAKDLLDRRPFDRLRTSPRTADRR